LSLLSLLLSSSWRVVRVVAVIVRRWRASLSPLKCHHVPITLVSVSLQHIDMHTVKVEDLTFASPFRITFNRDDYCHALVAYFDVEFSCCHKPLKISTGPHNEYTHWKQTVFYLKDVLTVKAGEELRVRGRALVDAICVCCRWFRGPVVGEWVWRCDSPRVMLQGEITCAPNAKNHRDLDIGVKLNFTGELSSCDSAQTYRLR
jgi:hypothetical protein